MSIVISELEHRPAADGASDGAPGGGASQGAVRIDRDQILAVLRRETSRRARLWAD